MIKRTLVSAAIIASFAGHAYAAGEAKNPRRNLPRAIRRVYIRILLFYIGGVTIIGLLVPSTDPGTRGRGKRIRLAGDVPSPINPPPACRFHTRCWKAQEICRTIEPPLRELRPGQRVACHFPENAPPGSDTPTPESVPSDPR